ncbi:MAG: hypothetical protein PVG03_16650 [Desulfarculaceae bacterium]|jgi:hypothetical protein
MKRKLFCLLLGLALVFPAMSALAAGDERPLTPQELAEFQGQIPGVEAEINATVKGMLQRNPSKVTPTKFQKYFKVEQKSSSPSRAVLRAKSAMQAGIQAYMKSLTDQGWVPVDNPAPTIKYKYKFGFSSFKFYCRISVDLTIWCVKLP